MMIRDRRTLVMSLLVPALAMPVLLTASYTMQERRERALRERVYAYAITGPEADAAPGVLTPAPATPARAGAGAGEGGARGEQAEGLVKPPPALPVVTVVYRADRDDSSEAAGRM